ncbi:MAG TPA: condensation domain-containing protein, partial [Bryobacteraceae bacterium]|nr:condensation domain-containing protein [Bryobacteraceae bacterium]
MAIDWCTLSGIGMAARHGADKLPGTVITPAQAPDIWRRILATSSAQVVVADARQTTPVTPQTTPATPAPKTPERSISTQESAPAAAPAPKAPARATGMLESALAVLWAEILGYDSVDPEEDFYALGGDSISGMQIVSRIQSDLGYTIRVPDLLEAGTVKALAELLRRKAAPKEAGIEPAPEMPAYPVGWEQRDVLRAEASAEMGTAFNLPTLLELPETLSTERLTAALTELVARHEVLRTRFREEGDDWVMEVLPASPVTLPEIDLPVNGDIALACQSRVRPFDFTSQPPVRFELLRLPGGRRMLFFDLHHSLADGFTVELLAAELAALCAGKALPAPARQLKDYAWWSRKGGGAKAREEARKYWLEIYRGELPRLELPTDRPRPPIHTWRGGTASFEIDPGVVKRLRAFASEHRVTPFVVVLSAWSAVLAKIAASEDIVIGVPVDNRDRSGLENMPGMMVSLLPLRLAVRGSDRVGGLLERVQAAHAGAMRHRAFGLGSLLEELAPPAAPDRTWLSEVTLSYMNFAEGSRDGGFPMVGLLRDSIKGDLSIYVRDLPERILVSIEYYADVFDAERIERLGASFETLLAALVNGTADTPIGNLPVVPAAEERRLRAFENGAQPPLPWGRGLAALFAERARECPDRVAVEDARFCWTYRELASHANGVAHRLIEAGVRPGDLVALAMDRGAEAIAALLGIVTAGAGYVPLELDYPQERNRVILADAGVAVVIADAAGRAALGPVAGITVFASEELMEMTAEEPPEIDWSGDPDAAPAYLMYTSGSTGQPKGVLVPQRAVVRISLGDDFAALGPEDRVLQCGPLAFDASTWEVWGPLLKGARLAIATREEILDPAAFEAALDRYGTTALFLTASLFNRQVDRDPSVFKRVRVLVSGGEAMSAVHAGRLLEACPNVRLVNGYGPTENTTFTTFHRVRREDVTGMGIPIGQPIAHSRAVILDGNGRRVPIGVWGEICAGGPGLAD